MDNCIFCKIVKGDIPSAKVYEDEDMIIIKDLNPQAPVHLLLIPKEHYAKTLPPESMMYFRLRTGSVLRFRLFGL